jgi:L-arabinokinase
LPWHRLPPPTRWRSFIILCPASQQRPFPFSLFGGLGLDRLPWSKLKEQTDFHFVTTGTLGNHDGNITVLPNRQYQYEDLVRASDVVVTKPGYGIVADALAHKVPILYTERGEFPEYPRLVEALRQCATSEFIPQSELLAGNLTPYLGRLLAKETNWPSIELDGAENAAAKILELLPDRS